jgi:hypothetical protein
MSLAALSSCTYYFGHSDLASSNHIDSEAGLWNIAQVLLSIAELKLFGFFTTQTIPPAFHFFEACLENIPLL